MLVLTTHNTNHRIWAFHALKKVQEKDFHSICVFPILPTEHTQLWLFLFTFKKLVIPIVTVYHFSIYNSKSIQPHEIKLIKMTKWWISLYYVTKSFQTFLQIEQRDTDSFLKKVSDTTWRLWQQSAEAPGSKVSSDQEVRRDSRSGAISDFRLNFRIETACSCGQWSAAEVLVCSFEACRRFIWLRIGLR